MKKFLLYFLILSGPMLAHAQFDRLKDSVVQVYGFVMTADSLVGIPGVTISVKGRNQGAFTNDQGVFSIPLLKGDKIVFTSIGYKPIEVQIPRDLKGNQYSMIQTMVTDAVFLPATIIKPRPTREQFERDFVNTKVPDDDIEIARQNTEAAKRRILLRGLPNDAREASNYYLRQSATRYSYLGQAPPQNIFNPVAWADFIQAWKRGDFKNTNN
ncbi:MAG: carboxypeptidase-like regulatory domain-containing protein [Bacteroidetes bacterium]|nr:carboxypeptidase-like regulatory domain-containing protein [Bacteroidota bacterium]